MDCQFKDETRGTLGEGVSEIWRPFDADTDRPLTRRKNPLLTRNVKGFNMALIT